MCCSGQSTINRPDKKPCVNLVGTQQGFPFSKILSTARTQKRECEASLFGLSKLASPCNSVAALYVLFSPPIAMPVYNRILFFPTRGYDSDFASAHLQHILRANDIKKSDVSFSVPGGKNLSGWFFKKAGSSKVMLVSHGNAGNISDRLILAESLLSCGTSVFLYDYEGYGESQGSPSVQKLCNDAVAAYDYLVSQEKIPPRDIIPYGESIGTGVTCYLSTQRSLTRFILQSGLLYDASLTTICGLPASIPTVGFPISNNIAVLKAPHPPVLLLHGKDDRFLPPRYSQLLFKLASAPKQLSLIDNMQHCREEANDPQFLGAINKFLAESGK